MYPNFLFRKTGWSPEQMRSSYYLECIAQILWKNFSPLLKLLQLSFAYLGLQTPQADLQIQSSQVLCPVEINQKNKAWAKEKLWTLGRGVDRPSNWNSCLKMGVWQFITIFSIFRSLWAFLGIKKICLNPFTRGETLSAVVFVNRQSGKLCCDIKLSCLPRRSEFRSPHNCHVDLGETHTAVWRSFGFGNPLWGFQLPPVDSYRAAALV